MRKLMKAAAGWLNNNQDVILASIIADSGSTPRGAGARMAITADGSFAGTIGGGAVEYRVQQMAAEALETKTSTLKSFQLNKNDIEDLGMVCGGGVTVYIQYISHENEKARILFDSGAKMFEENNDSWLVTDITDENGWHMSVITKDNALDESYFVQKPVLLDFSGRKLYIEPLTKSGRVYIFGGGHISRELTPVLSHLGFSCFVFDDKERFARKDDFPNADQVILGNFENISASVKITESDYVVIMTRGHASDLTVQAQALRLKPRYIGVIGSRKKIAVVSAKLRDMGFSQDEIDLVHTPIGISIKADTPAEIAISIAAELIQVRAESLR